MRRVCPGCTPSQQKKECYWVFWGARSHKETYVVRSECVSGVVPNSRRKGLTALGKDAIVVVDALTKLCELVEENEIEYISIGRRRSDGALLVTCDSDIGGKLFLAAPDGPALAERVKTVVGLVSSHDDKGIYDLARAEQRRYRTGGRSPYHSAQGRVIGEVESEREDPF